VGESSPQWQKAAAMGAQIDPNNPLYSGAGGGGTYTAMAPAAAKPDVDFDIAGQSAASTPAPDFDLGDAKNVSDSEAPAGTASSGMDFDLHSPSSPAPAAEAPKAETPSSFDFDLSGIEMTGGGTKPKSAPADLEVDPTQRSQPVGSPGLDLADLSLDMPGDTGTSGGGGGGNEAVGTKLELAKAYLEIGDKDGAREILQEVAKEGSASQKEEAQKLIASL
jgi:pilus assembly protein FimV